MTQLAANELQLDYREQGCSIVVPAAGSEQARQVVEMLLQGASLDELAASAPKFAQSLPELLVELDRMGLLTEGKELPRVNGRTGRGLYREVKRIATAMSYRSRGPSFYQTLRSGVTSPSQITGYAVEYWHVVHNSAALIAPALAHAATRRTYETLQDFLAAELHHDRIIEEALASVGIGPEVLGTSIPLPATHSLCSALGVLAAQDPLSFKAGLFLLEQPSGAFHSALVDRAQALGLPETFSTALLRHASLNDDLDHGDISARLLAEVPFVTDSEERVVKRHVAIFVETILLLDRQVLESYATAGPPRLSDD